METFKNRKLAECQKGSDGTIVEALGKIWLLSVGPRRNSGPAGTKAAEIGPLPIRVGQEYYRSIYGGDVAAGHGE